MEGRFQDTGFFLTVAVGTDLIHIPSLALFEEDQIHEITGDDTDDDLRDHELQDIVSPAGIGQQKNDGLVRGGEIDGKKGSECDQTSGVEVGGDDGKTALWDTAENGPGQRAAPFGFFQDRVHMFSIMLFCGFHQKESAEKEGQGFQRIKNCVE